MLMMTKVTSRRILVLTTLGMIAVVGCASRAPEIPFALSPEAEKLEPKSQEQIRELLREECGTLTRPKLLGETIADRNYLSHGSAVYRQQCATCHGINGDGKGTAAEHLYPRPRNFLAGIFKFTSTGNQKKPLRDDLIKLVKRGAIGTSMPAFDILPERDLNAVVDYVLALARKGEFESRLVLEAESLGEPIASSDIPAIKESVLDRWKSAAGEVVIPRTTMPIFTVESVKAGKRLFTAAGCVKCHGEDGRGMIVSNPPLKDVWGNETRAADLTAGMFHGGGEPIDLYRRIAAGITGSPMPSHQDLPELKLTPSEPDPIWNLVAFVQYVSNQRRRGEIPHADHLVLTDAAASVPGVIEPSTSPGSSATPGGAAAGASKSAP